MTDNVDLGYFDFVSDLAAHQIIAFAGIDGIERWRFQTAGQAIDAPIKPRLVVTTARGRQMRFNPPRED